LKFESAIKGRRTRKQEPKEPVQSNTNFALSDGMREVITGAAESLGIVD
jgi:hypothetical protein